MARRELQPGQAIPAKTRSVIVRYRRICELTPLQNVWVRCTKPSPCAKMRARRSHSSYSPSRSMLSITRPPKVLHTMKRRSITHSQTDLGRKKLQTVETEIQRLASIRHQNLLAVLAVKLTTPSTNGSLRLVILSEKRPTVTLDDVLEDCDWLREDRASVSHASTLFFRSCVTNIVQDYLLQIISALHAAHANDIVHRGLSHMFLNEALTLMSTGLSTKCIGLAPREEGGPSKIVKVFKAGYHVRLLDLHRSDPFGFNMDPKIDEVHIPEGWLLHDTVESPLVYTRSRDIHAAGIVLLQMLMGRDVTERFPDVHTALRNCA